MLGLCFCAGFSLVAATRVILQLQYIGFSLQRLLLLQAQALECVGSVVVAQALEYRLNSCGTQASLPFGMWDSPRSGL